MSYYLIDHPPSVPQSRQRRAAISGNVVVHTTESALDAMAPDTGAEAVAGFISRRTDHGSYHLLADSDSSVAMLPDDVEAFGCTTGENRHAWHIAAACRATDWNPDQEWTRTVIARMGEEIRGFWLRNGFDPTRARWGYPSESGVNAPLLFCHGDIQPLDRSDAWKSHPRRAELDRMLFDAVRKSPTQAKAGPRMFSIVTGTARRHSFAVRSDGTWEYRWEKTPGKGDYDLPVSLASQQHTGSPAGLRFVGGQGFMVGGNLLMIHAFTADDRWYWCREVSTGGKFSPWGQF